MITKYELHISSVCQNLPSMIHQALQLLLVNNIKKKKHLYEQIYTQGQK